MEPYLGFLPALLVGFVHLAFLPALLVAPFVIWLSAFITSTVSALRGPIFGPKFAKITILWKLITIRTDTYTKKLRELHRYREVVQVGPNEFSIGNPELLWPFRQLELEHIVPYKLLISSEAVDALPAALQMANVFRYEPLIERCNHALLRALVGHAEREEEINLADMIARYAYDTMFCTTTGSAPGFLERKQDVSALTEAIDNWKFYSILYGSYLRFHPVITKILQWVGLGNGLKRAIVKHVDIERPAEEPCIANALHSEEDQSNLQRARLEASIAVMTAGADPAITHILSSIYFTYRNAELVEALRDEIERADLSQPPRLKELIHAKPRMPLLHAVLQESLRLIQMTGISYILPTGEAAIGDVNVPEACTICCEPSVAHVNPNIFGTSAEAFNPSRWLKDPAIARSFRSHVVTFGAGTNACPGKELHLSIVAKIFTQIISYFDFEMASVSTLSSPVNMTFNDFKNLTIAKVVLPKNIKPIITGLSSPLRATAPAFAPDTTTAPELPPGFTPRKVSFGDGNGDINGSFKIVGNYAARIGGVTDFIPNAEAHGSESESNSPTLSNANTTNSSDVSATPMTWTDAQTLEDILGLQMMNKMMKDFDPTTELKRRPLFKTGRINEPRNRYLLHDAIERVWGGRLNHETDRKDNCMYIWVPGTRLPKWLFRTYQFRHQNDPKKKPEQNINTSNRTNAEVAPKAPRAVNSVWTNFAQDENTRYSRVAAMSGEEFAAAERKKVDESGEKKPEYAPRAPVFKETFKQTGTKAIDEESASKDASTVVNEITSTEAKKATLPPHLRARAATPPHLRSRSVDSAVSETKDAEGEAETTVWCAAKLPSPCSSD